MAELNGIPVFKVTFDEKDNKGIDFISLVDMPAIQSNWVALKNTKEPLKFAIVEDKQIITGPILIPDAPIYRIDPVTKQEYYVVFTASVIEGLVRKLQAQQKTINLNYQHQENSQVKQAVIQEIWISGKIDKSQSLGFSHPDGSAFVSAYIGDKKFWNEEIKTGKVKGFSIEGFLDMELKKIKQMKFITAKTDKGIEINSPAESFAVGVDVTTKDDAGKDVPISDGSYTLENGSTITCVGGKVSEIAEASSEDLNPEEMAAMTKLFSAVTKPLMDEITALKTRLDKIPGGGSYTKKDDGKDDGKKAPLQTAMEKITAMKKHLNNK